MESLALVEGKGEHGNIFAGFGTVLTRCETAAHSKAWLHRTRPLFDFTPSRSIITNNRTHVMNICKMNQKLANTLYSGSACFSGHVFCAARCSSRGQNHVSSSRPSTLFTHSAFFGRLLLFRALFVWLLFIAGALPLPTHNKPKNC